MINGLKKIFKRERSFIFLTPALVWQILFFIVPLCLVSHLSFFTGILQNFTFDYFNQILYPAYFYVIARSFLLASITTIACLVVGYPIACYVSLCVSDSSKSRLLFFLTLPFLINLLVQIYAWYFILEKNGMLNKVLSVFIASSGNFLNNSFFMYVVMFHIYLPFMIMPIYTILEKLDLRLVEASCDLGASLLETFCKIIIPLSKRGIKTGFFLVYVTAFGEYVIPSLLGGQKKFYVGTLISEYFFIGKDWHIGAAFTTLSFSIFIVTLFGYNKLINWLIAELQKVRTHVEAK